MRFLAWLRHRATGQLAGDHERRLYMEGRDAFKYCEGDRCAIIGAELLTGSVGRVVDAGRLTHWQPPYENEEIPPAKRNEIIEMLGAYLASRGTKFELDWQK